MECPRIRGATSGAPRCIRAGLPVSQQTELVTRALSAEWQTAASIASICELSFDQVSTILRRLFRSGVAEKLSFRKNAAPVYRVPCEEERAS